MRSRLVWAHEFHLRFDSLECSQTLAWSRAEDVIPRILSSIARPAPDAEHAADHVRTAVAALLPTILEGSSLPAADADVSVTRPPLGALSNVQPFFGRRSRSKPPVSDAAADATPQPELDRAAAGRPPSPAAESATQQPSPRLTWARRVADAPKRAVQAARTAYVPLGRQVWLPPERLDTLAETLQAEQPPASPESLDKARTDADRKLRRSPSLQLSRSLLCPPAHRLPSYR
jgi:hypothetical protein